jgi:D-sedoheptulose 7-phosphate isomerase
MTITERERISNLLVSDPVEDYLTKMSETIASISRTEIWDVVNALYSAWRTGKHVYICGNGGSAATASHMTNDLNKLVNVKGKPRFKAVSLTDNIPLITAWANDSEFENIFVQQLKNFVQTEDVVIGISTSGLSENVLRAINYANEMNAVTIGFTGNEGGQLKLLADYCIFVPDENIHRQEDGHLILDHLISATLHELILQFQE